MFFILGRLFFASDWSRAIAGATIALIAVTTHFAQFRVVASTVLATLLGIPARFAVVVTMAGLILSYATQIHRAPEIIAAGNTNAGLRLLFIEDTFSSLKDTYGLGIGYGTESVRWRYKLPNRPDFTFMPDVNVITQDRLLELLSRGVHNSFAQAALRTGVLGFVLLVCAYGAAFPPRSLPRPVRAHASMLFVIIFVASFVNPALESPLQEVGIGFLYGYLLALRARAEAWCRVSRPSSARLPPQLSLIPDGSGVPERSFLATEALSTPLRGTSTSS
jgi:O-antigen ligase